MSKKISDEAIRLDININGNEAQKEISRLKQNTAELKSQIAGLRVEEKLLSKRRKEDIPRLKEIRKEIENLTKSIEDNDKKIHNEIQSMKLMDMTMEQLRIRANSLRYVLSNITTNSEEFKKGQKELQQINERISELRNGGKGARQTIEGLSASISKYSGLGTAVIAGLAGMSFTVGNVISANNKLADAQTAVAKTTGLTNAEVKELTKSFSEFDTRTKRIDLLKIAEIGGRLGVPKSEIKDFTKEVDKAYVALGDSFSGGVEKVAEKLGKIKGLFKETKDMDMGTAINKIGSSLNELGASGAASEENVAEFAVRVGALPEKLKPTVAEAMALGAAFEESGIDAERSGTAYSNFVRTAAKESGAFAEVMGITKKEVEDLINSDPTEFFLKFAEGAKGLDAVEMANMLDHLKLNDQYLVSILGAASDNSERFRNTIELSNQALEEGISLQQEFDKVNNNAAAVYEKVSKKFAGIFTNEAVAKTLQWLVEVMGRLLGVTVEGGEKMSTLSAVVISLVRLIVILGAGFVSSSLAIGVYNTLLKESLLRTLALETAEKTRLTTGKLMLSFQSLWNIALNKSKLFLGKYIVSLFSAKTATEMQAAAQAKLNAVTSASPWGAVAALVGLVASAYMTYSMWVDEATEKQKTLEELQKEAIDNSAGEVSQLERLYKAATDKNKTDEERIKAVDKLQKMYPSYFGNMSKEEIMAGRLKGKYLELKDAILAAAKARVLEKEIEEITRQQLKLKEDTISKVSAEMNYRKTASKEDAEISKEREARTLKEYTNKTSALNKRAEAYAKGIEKNTEKASPYIEDKEKQSGGVSTYKTNFGGAEKGSKGSGTPKKNLSEAERKFAEERKKILEEIGKWDEKAQEQEFKSWAYRIEIMEDGLEKTLASISLETEKKLEALEKQKYTAEEFAKLDKMIASAKDGSDEKAKLEQAKANWKAYNDELEQFKIQEAVIAGKKMRLAQQKFDNEEFSKKEEANNKALKDLEFRQKEELAKLDSFEKMKSFLKGKVSEEELAKIDSWEKGKQKVLEHHQKEQLELQSAYLQLLISELEQIPAFQITPEQMKQLEELRIKLVEIGIAKAEMKGKNEEGQGNSFSSLSSFGGGNADIFGLSQEQWEAMFQNTDKIEEKILKVGAAINVAKNLMTTYYNFVKANQEAELRRYEVAHQRKRQTLEAQLEAGIISQQEYKHATIANDNELAMKRYQLELDAAKREKAMRIADTISNTAMAIMSIWSKQGANPITAGILTGLVSAMGAVQVATIASQPLPQPPAVVGAEEGYYPVMRKQDGKMFRARKRVSKSGVYDEPTMLVGEQGKNFPELVVSGRAMKRIDPKIQQDFMQEVARVEGFERGYYPTVGNVGNDDLMMKMMGLIQKNTEALERLEQNGVRGVFEKSARTGKDLEEMQSDYRRLVEKNKH